MIITRVKPTPPPSEIVMRFSPNEGWALVAALNRYANQHPDAAHAADWRMWAKALDKELRAS